MRLSQLPNLLSLLLFVSAASASVVQLDERGLPITSTTTRTVQAYVTETVYIYANSQGKTVTTTVAAKTTSAVQSASTTAKTTAKTSSQSSSSSASVPTSLVLIVQPTSTKLSSSSKASSSSKISSSTKVSSSTKASSSSTKASSSSTKASSTSTAATSTSTGTGTDSSRPIVAGYYPDWVESTLAPEGINWNKFDWIDFAFAILDSNYNIVFTGWNSDDLLKRTVKLGHAAGKKVKLSIGGWTGSGYFSTAVSTAARRQDLATKMLAMYNQYSLDGLDIDWEYPGVMGQDGNIVSSSDSANYLLFLQLLRKTLPAGAKITAATQVWPFAGTNGNPLRDVSAFAEVFDWITVMNYDVWGSSNTPGPNAPLSDGCGNSLQPLANAYGALSSWTNAGFPAKKLMLGTAAYGYLSGSSATKLVDKRAEIPFQHSHMKTRSWSSRSLLPNRHRNRRSEFAKRVTVVNDGGGTTDGQLNFSELIRQGALGWDNSARKWVGAGGFTRVWDSCSSTPFLRNPSSNQVITYDDPDSLSLKGQFVKQSAMAGVNVWEISGDDNAWDLVTALRSGMGL